MPTQINSFTKNITVYGYNNSYCYYYGFTASVSFCDAYNLTVLKFYNLAYSGWLFSLNTSTASCPNNYVGIAPNCCRICKLD